MISDLIPSDVSDLSSPDRKGKLKQILRSNSKTNSFISINQTFTDLEIEKLTAQLIQLDIK